MQFRLCHIFLCIYNVHGVWKRGDGVSFHSLSYSEACWDMKVSFVKLIVFSYAPFVSASEDSSGEFGVTLFS